jgi:ssDNA-binding replication factor A large subunit
LPIVSIKGKITLIEEPTMVGAPPHTKMRRGVVLTDNTGSLTIVFCRDNVLSVPFIEGNVVTVDNLYLSKWNGSINGNVGNETSFKVF